MTQLPLSLSEPHGILLAWDAFEAGGFDEPTDDLRKVINAWGHLEREYLLRGDGPRARLPEWLAFQRACITVHAIEREGLCVAIVNNGVHDFELYSGVRKVSGNREYTWRPLHYAPYYETIVWPTVVGASRRLGQVVRRRSVVEDVGREVAVTIGALFIPHVRYGTPVLPAEKPCPECGAETEATSGPLGDGVYRLCPLCHWDGSPDPEATPHRRLWYFG